MGKLRHCDSFCFLNGDALEIAIVRSCEKELPTHLGSKSVLMCYCDRLEFNCVSGHFKKELTSLFSLLGGI